jgi:hypothetical protein
MQQTSGVAPPAAAASTSLAPALRASAAILPAAVVPASALEATAAAVASLEPRAEHPFRGAHWECIHSSEDCSAIAFDWRGALLALGLVTGKVRVLGGKADSARANNFIVCRLATARRSPAPRTRIVHRIRPGLRLR